MKMTKTVIAAAAIAAAGTTATAGGLAPVVVEPVEMVVMEPKGSINSGYVVLGLLAALVAASGSF